MGTPEIPAGWIQCPTCGGVGARYTHGHCEKCDGTGVVVPMLPIDGVYIVASAGSRLYRRNWPDKSRERIQELARIANTYTGGR